MNRILATIVSLAGMSLVASAADDKPHEDLARVQGKWEMTVQAKDGRAIRLVKDIQGTKEWLTAYDGPVIVRQHRVDFSLESLGDVRLFTYTNYVVTEGPQKGATLPGKFSYIYKLHDDMFIEARGLLVKDKSKPDFIAWKRVEEEKVAIALPARKKAG